MAFGNRIILTLDRGVPVEGIVDTAEYPGTIMQLDPSQATVGGRFHWVVYNRGADGDRPAGPLIVLREDFTQGKGIDPSDSNNAYTAATRGYGFIPWAGCELNVLFANVAGTADDIDTDAVGSGLLIVDDGTGKVIVTTGSVEDEPFLALEDLTDPTADSLVHAICCR